jgi:hypothetical protein
VQERGAKVSGLKNKNNIDLLYSQLLNNLVGKMPSLTSFKVLGELVGNTHNDTMIKTKNPYFLKLWVQTHTMQVKALSIF